MSIVRRLKPSIVSSVLARIFLAPRGFLRGMWRVGKLSVPDQEDLERYKAWFDRSTIITKGAAPEKVFLIASFMPLSYCIKVEGLLGHAMCQRGYKVVVVTNADCQSVVRQYHELINGFEVLILDDYLSLGSIFRLGNSLKNVLSSHGDLLKKVKELRYRNAHIGLHSLATLSAGNDVELTTANATNSSKLKRILARSVFLVDAATSLVKQLSPSLVLSMEKGFVGTSELFYATINNDIRYVQWTGCHEPNSIMFKGYDWSNFREHPFSISDKNWDRIKELPWSDGYSEEVMNQFRRGYTEGQWFKYKNLTANQHESDKLSLMKELRLDPSKKVAVIYSHILNDANLFYGQDLFAGGYEEWLVETVRAAESNKSVNWILKLHPANMYRNPSLASSRKYGELQALEKAFKKVPDFLTVVYPDNSISPLSFFGITDYGITVRGTVGLELPCFGIPALTAGTGRYSEKKFTIDSSSCEEYLSKIQHIEKIPSLTQDQVQLAQRYAFHVFQVRPARYSGAFTDDYRIPQGYFRRRDVNLDTTTMKEVLAHPQIEKMIAFLCSDAHDFLDNSYV